MGSKKEKLPAKLAPPRNPIVAKAITGEKESSQSKASCVVASFPSQSTVSYSTPQSTEGQYNSEGRSEPEKFDSNAAVALAQPFHPSSLGLPSLYHPSSFGVTSNGAPLKPNHDANASMAGQGIEAKIATSSFGSTGGIQQALNSMISRHNHRSNLFALGLASHSQFAQVQSNQNSDFHPSGFIPGQGPYSVAAQKYDGTEGEPRPNDVLFGRGGTHKRHPGNRRMQMLADIHRDAYNQAERDDKTEITWDIVRIIKATGGRFLKYDKAISRWQEVSIRIAREKVSHAIRDGRTKPLGPIDMQEVNSLPLLSENIRTAAARMSSLHEQGAHHAFGEEEAEILEQLLSPSSSSTDPDASERVDEVSSGTAAKSKKEVTNKVNDCVIPGPMRSIPSSLRLRDAVVGLDETRSSPPAGTKKSKKSH